MVTYLDQVQASWIQFASFGEDEPFKVKSGWCCAPCSISTPSRFSASSSLEPTTPAMMNALTVLFSIVTYTHILKNYDGIFFLEEMKRQKVKIIRGKKVD